MNKKRGLGRKKPTSKSRSSFPILPVMALVIITFSLLAFGNSLSPKKVDEKMLTADYGGIDKVLSQSGEWIDNIRFAYFDNKIVKTPSSLLAESAEQRVLSATTSNKWVDINLTEQKMRAYEDNNLVYEFPVSSGLPWTPTIKGDFNVWFKIKYTRMTGGSVEAGNYYDLPNVPFNMFFYKDYALHGAYWHNNFGHQMSHGCVNMRPADAEKIFYWTDPPLPEGQNAVMTASTKTQGTRVIVHD